MKGLEDCALVFLVLALPFGIMGLDLKTHAVVLPAADFLPPKEGERRGAMKPSSFVLLVVAR
jgi:hypothetical protein